MLYWPTVDPEVVKSRPALLVLSDREFFDPHIDALVAITPQFTPVRQHTIQLILEPVEGRQVVFTLFDELSYWSISCPRTRLKQPSYKSYSGTLPEHG